MNAAQEVLTLENAPRDPAQLATKGAYKLRKLAEQMGLLTDPTTRGAFLAGKPDEMAQVVAQGLRTRDGANPAAAQNGVVATPQQQVAATPVVTTGLQMPPVQSLVLPSAGGGTAVAEAPAQAATGRKRTPQTAAAPDGLVEIKATIETLTASINALAATVVGIKQQVDKPAPDFTQYLAAILSTQQTALSLLLMLAENNLGAGQGELFDDARTNISNFPTIFGAQQGKG